MRFFQHFVLGIKNYGVGLNFIFKHKLYWFVIFPIILFLFIFWLGSYFERLEWSASNEIKRNITEIKTLNGLISRTLKIIFFDKLYYLFTKFTMYFVIICLAPIMAILSERIEKILTGNKYKSNIFQIFNDIKRSILLNSRLILIEYAIIVVLIGIGIVIGGRTELVLTFIIPIILGFYFYGFGFIDYINERRRLNIQQSVHFVSKHRGLAFALGMVYASCFLSFNYLWREYWSMPIDPNTQIIWGLVLTILFILVVFAPILAITSSTLSMHTIVNLSTNQYALKFDVPKNEEVKNESAKNDDNTN